MCSVHKQTQLKLLLLLLPLGCAHFGSHVNIKIYIQFKVKGTSLLEI